MIYLRFSFPCFLIATRVSVIERLSSEFRGSTKLCLYVCSRGCDEFMVDKPIQGLSPAVETTLLCMRCYGEKSKRNVRNDRIGIECQTMKAEF